MTAGSPGPVAVQAGSRPLAARLRRAVGDEVLASLGLLAVVIVGFSLVSDRFLSGQVFTSIAFQLPELGLLTLAMMMPIISGGFNLAVTFNANIAGLAMASVLHAAGGANAGPVAFMLGALAALGTGAAAGGLMGLVIAYTGAHPILVSLSMMIFLRGLGEFLTHGGDISGFPPFVAEIGQGTFLHIPTPLWIFAVGVVAWHLLMTRSRLGFATRMIGSNLEATRYSGINTRRALVLIYMLSGLMCGIAGIVMLTRFSSVRVGHGESYLLITVLACFLGGVDPFGGFGRVLPVVIALLTLQTIASGLNLLGANQHLATALWGAFLLAVLIVRRVRLPRRPRAAT